MVRAAGPARPGEPSMNWMLMPLRRYAEFTGRSRRKEYWMFILFQIILTTLAVLLLLVTGDFSSAASSAPSGLLIVLGLIYLVAFFIPSLAVQVRRFHDQDKSGWFVLLGFIPYVGGLIVLVFMCLDGTRGQNRFGPDPKQTEALAETFS
jgi:uncharacterized membrane protein YhaH (DUF805 family)